MKQRFYREEMDMTKDIFVFIESKDGAVRKTSFELMSKAKEIAERSGSSTYAVIVGHSVRQSAEELRAWADRVIFVDKESLKEYRWDSYTGIMEALIKKYEPNMVFGASTLTGKDLFARLAARLDVPIVSDAIGIDFEGENPRVKKPLFGGKIISWMGLGSSETALITFRPNTFSIEKRALAGEIIEETLEILEDSRMHIIGVSKADMKKVDLQEADFIICGGRGMKAPECFQMLEEVADVMGGRVGATRAVVDAKWRDYDDQVGKSGKTVSPKLYIGCGISGALHHTMGMDTSKVIVAVNKDPNAPIFQYADYGIVDDLFDIVPILKEELRRTKEEI
jgi:electron transfer flavoprotein alpha subunit